jgi:hypothetical protein
VNYIRYMPLVRERLRDHAVNLAVFRVAVFGIILASPEAWRAASEASVLPALRTVPEGLALFARWVPIRADLAEQMQTILIASSLCALVGFCTRASAAIATLSGIYVFALSQFSGAVVHDMHLFWFAALLAASPSGDALSIDRVLTARRGLAPPGSALAYGVPLMTARVLLGLVYFFPGAWKLAESGLDWVLSDNLRNQICWKWFEHGDTSPVFRIDRHPWLCRAGAGGVIAFELSFLPLAIWPRTRKIAAALGLVFHALSEVLLRIPFVSLWGCYACLVPWSALWDRVRAARGQRSLASDERAPGIESAGRAAPALVLGAALVAVVAVQGIRGAVQAWPFACYPTFQSLAPAVVPDLVLEAVWEDGRTRVLPDGPGAGGSRTQEGWATAWQVAGLYGAPPTSARLSAYWTQARSTPRIAAAARGASHIRVHRAWYSVLPEDRAKPPLRAELLGTVPAEAPR